MNIDITEQQIEELIKLIHEVRISDFLQKADEFGIKTTELSVFKKEFILGKQSFLIL
jgi:hypothetical protein